MQIVICSRKETKGVCGVRQGMEVELGPLIGLGSGSRQETLGPLKLGNGGEFVKLLFTK